MSEYNRLVKELQSTEQKLTKLTDIYLEGSVSEQAYKTLKEEYEKKIADIKKIIEKYELNKRNRLEELTKQESDIKRELELLDAKKILEEISEKQYLIERYTLQTKLDKIKKTREAVYTYDKEAQDILQTITKGGKMVVCPGCGAPNQDTWGFCYNCNKNLRESQLTDFHLNRRLTTSKFSSILLITLLITSAGFIALTGHMLYLNKTLTVEKTQLNEKLNSIIEENRQLIVHINDLSRYKLRRPTYDELKIFLLTDNTDKNPFVKETYNCMHFARDLQQKAKLAGWNISYVSVNYHYRYSTYGHACNGVYLADGRHLYIEPQTDKIFPSLDELICDLVGASKPSYITILHYVEVWP
ncbi:MAG: zinc ribbon domain-containing protein [Nitrososphaerota archaeon]